MKIDIFPHIFPRPYYDRMQKVSDAAGKYVQKRSAEMPMMLDVDLRLRMMDQYPDYAQVLTAAGPSIETFCDPTLSPEVSRVLNDGMAELCVKYPDRFLGFAASLPMNNVDAALQEVDRAIKQLGARGVQIYTNVNGRPLDEPEFRPLFEKMAGHDLPIWLHPSRPSSFPDYQTEKKSKYELWWVFGWPYETSVAMYRLVFTGIFDAHPNLKVIGHHMGAMIPYFARQVGPGFQLGSRTPPPEADLIKHNLKRDPSDYLHLFLADTAVLGPGPLTCGLSFFGIDNILFGTDMPFDSEGGYFSVRETIRGVDSMAINATDRAKIYEGNARRLLKLKPRS